MPSTVRAILFAAASFALVSMTAVQAYAIPESLRNIDYRRRDLNVRIIEETSTHTVQTSPAVVPSSDLNRRDTDIINQLGLLNNYYKQVNINRDNIRDYASRAPDSQNDNSFQQQCATELTSFYSNLFGAEDILKILGCEKGLANYDRDNELETILKDIININKDTLSYIYVIVRSIPVLGPILGPIVGDIKCLLDEVLDTLENFTDGLLNELRLPLRGVLQSYSDSMCRGSFEILGLCLDIGGLDLL